MYSTLVLDHGSRNGIQYDQTIFLVFDKLCRYQKYRGRQLRNLDFPVPAKLTDLLFPSTGVYLEEGHSGHLDPPDDLVQHNQAYTAL